MLASHLCGDERRCDPLTPFRRCISSAASKNRSARPTASPADCQNPLLDETEAPVFGRSVIGLAVLVAPGFGVGVVVPPGVTVVAGVGVTSASARVSGTVIEAFASTITVVAISL